jgi:hypothetical protein
MGVPELESGTSSLSATRSNQLSYTPAIAARPSIDQARMRAEEFTECRFALQGNLPAESARMRRILGVADRSAGFDRRRSLRRASRAAALRLRTSASSAERADGAIRSSSKSTFPARDWFVRMNLVRQNEIGAPLLAPETLSSPSPVLTRSFCHPTRIAAACSIVATTDCLG